MKKYLIFLLLIVLSCQKDELESIGGIEREDMIFAVSESKVVDGQTIFFNILSEEEHTLIIFDEETQSVVTKESFQPKVGLFDRRIYTNSLPKKRLQLILQTTEELEKTYINVDWYIYSYVRIYSRKYR